MAFTLVLVSFSCTGPIVGALLVEAAGGLALKPILGMFGFGLAFALPFTLFAIFPDWLKKMPKSVVQSNWYYGTEFNTDINYVKAYHDLQEHGYDQIPTGSNHSSPENFGMTVEYCKKHIAKEHLPGFLQTPWRATLEEYRSHHIEAVQQVGSAIAKI